MPRLQSADQLEDLGFVGDRTERAVYHTLSAGNAQVVVDDRPALLVILDRTHAAGSRTWPYLMGYGIIRTYRLTLTAFDTLLRIDHRPAVLHGNRPAGTDLAAGMRHTAHTVIRHIITVLRAGITGRRNDLHQRRLIVLLVDIALLKPLRQMHGLILRPQGKPHGETDPLTHNGPLSVDILIFRFFIIHDLIRKGLHVILQILRLISQTGHFFKNTTSVLTNLRINSSHDRTSLSHFPDPLPKNSPAGHRFPPLQC